MPLPAYHGSSLPLYTHSFPLWASLVAASMTLISPAVLVSTERGASLYPNHSAPRLPKLVWTQLLNFYRFR